MNIVLPRAAFGDRRYYDYDRYNGYKNSYYPSFRKNNAYYNNSDSYFNKSGDRYYTNSCNNDYYNNNNNNNNSYYDNNQGWQTNNPRFGYPGEPYCCNSFQGQRSLVPNECFVDIHEKRIQGFDPMGSALAVRSTSVRVVQPYGEACKYQRVTKNAGVTHHVTMERSVETVTDIRSPPVFVEKLSVNIKVSFREPYSGEKKVVEQSCVLQGIKPAFIQPKFFYPR